ncbi:MAG: hypothetical protein RIQ81_2314 [Pseudomonadota bacterium]|jgi:C1A family cysteine protease
MLPLASIKTTVRIAMAFLFTAISSSLFAQDLPPALDLRNVEGRNLVSSVKRQSGGTCWTHATAAALESNLLLSGEWTAQQETGEANLAEYHLDWWNGFNLHFNLDTSPVKNGLTVHEGGDFLVATAYLSRGGAVRDIDGQSYTNPPGESVAGYHYYYPRHVEWLASENQVDARRRIKEAVRNHGVVGTALAWATKFYNSSAGTFYQPVSSTDEANHAVAIAGWDDSKTTQASKPGAWLIKNSWGTDWGKNGYFWISYEDKVSGRHPDMGAVSFRDVERLAYDRIYFHDYHGWRDTKKGVLHAVNSFTAKGPSARSAMGLASREFLKAVSFYTTEHDSDYMVRIYKVFDGTTLGGEVAWVAGHEANKGLHTVDLPNEVALEPGESFHVSVELSKGGHAFDRTSNVPVLLCGPKTKTIVKSKASPGESRYLAAGKWVDLTTADPTANFAIKALSVLR